MTTQNEAVPNPTSFKNFSGEIIPPFAVMLITDSAVQGETLALQARKPDSGATQGTYLINGPLAVAINGFGVGSDAYGVQAQYSSGNSPSPGQEWGPRDDWVLHSNGNGFTIIGGIQQGNLFVVRVAKAPAPKAKSYKLTNCEDSSDILFVGNDLEIHVGKIILAKHEGIDNCYLVEDVPEGETCGGECVLYLGSFNTCLECTGCWQLTPCTTGTAFVVRGREFRALVGKVVLWSDDLCYTVSSYSDCSEATDGDINDVKATYGGCSECGDCTRLQNCNDASYKYVRTDSFGFPDAVLGKVIKVKGECYTVLEIDYACPSDPEAFLFDGMAYADCNECGCYKFVQCPPDTGIKYTTKATWKTSGLPFDLSAMQFGHVVTLGSTTAPECWQYVGPSQECTVTENLEIIDSRPLGCFTCVYWKITQCSGQGSTTIYTKDDLSSYWDSAGNQMVANKVLKRAEDGLCYDQLEEVSLLADQTWADFSVEEEYNTCAGCIGERYKLEDQECEGPECGYGDCGSETAYVKRSDIITEEDLNVYLNQLVKYDGVCWLVSEAEVADTTTHTTLGGVTGPYVDCFTCVDTENCIEIVTGMEGTGSGCVGVYHRSKIIGDFTLCELPDLNFGLDCTAGGGSSLSPGCGIYIISDVVSVNNTQIAGLGLIPGPGCSISINATCGVHLVGDELRFDNMSVADDGLLGVGTDCKLKVDQDCGITVSPTGVKVNRDELMGDGLILDNDVSMCGIKVKEDCGITVDENGVSVKIDTNPCASLLCDENEGLSVKLHQTCQTIICDEGLKVDPEALAGDGLEKDPDDCRLKVKAGLCENIIVSENGIDVDPTKLFGTGLVAEGICKLAAIPYTGGSCIVVAGYSISVVVDPAGGLTCGVSGLKVVEGCGIILTGGAVNVNNIPLSGAGLFPGIGCAIEVGQGPGIEVTANAVQVDKGCGLKFGGLSDKTLEVDNTDLVAGASHLKAISGCAIDLKTPVTLPKIITDITSVEVNLSTSELEVKIIFNYVTNVEVLTTGAAVTAAHEKGTTSATEC